MLPISIDEDENAIMLEKATGWLLITQDPCGFWSAPMETNVTLDAEDLFLREVLGIGEPKVRQSAAVHILSGQNPDGGWSLTPGGLSDLSTSIEAYFALRLAGIPKESEPMLRAAAFCRSAGGPRSARMATRLWLAVFGLWSWEDLPPLLPEIALMPRSAPVAIDKFSGWSRIALASLSAVYAKRPHCSTSVTLTELRAPNQPASPPSRKPSETLLRLMAKNQKRIPPRVRAEALDRLERWLLQHQERDGTWLAVHLLTVFAVLGLHALGRPINDPVMEHAIISLRRFEVWYEKSDEELSARRIECVGGAVWETTLAIKALRETGLDSSHPALQSAARWLMRHEVQSRGDWQIRRPKLRPSGWSFSPENTLFPDCDDTASALIALESISFYSEYEEAQKNAVMERASAWLRGMQSSNGGWASYDADNNSRHLENLPFCDFGEATDPPSADVTAHVLSALATQRNKSRSALQKGTEWVLSQQEADGSWFGRWGVNHIYGTWLVMEALRDIGLSEHHRSRCRAIDWVLCVQNSDGGWGEDVASYADPKWRGRGVSTPTQTAWALLTLATMRREDRLSAAAARGLAFLRSNQLSDGSWQDQTHTGTGFPGDFYMGYPNYAKIFPTMAIAKWLA